MLRGCRCNLRSNVCVALQPLKRRRGNHLLPQAVQPPPSSLHPFSRAAELAAWQQLRALLEAPPPAQHVASACASDRLMCWQFASSGAACCATAAERAIAALLQSPAQSARGHSDTFGASKGSTELVWRGGDVDASMIDPSATYGYDAHGRLCVVR